MAVTGSDAFKRRNRIVRHPKTVMFFSLPQHSGTKIARKRSRVTNLEAVKIEFRSSFSGQPSALTRAVLKTKHTRNSREILRGCAF